MTTTITAEQITTATPGKINGHCDNCDTFTVLHADFLCANCTEPTVEPYINNFGYSGLSVTHPANEHAILITGDADSGFEAWWSDSIRALCRSINHDRVVEFAKARIVTPR